jgi:hypothetical protein
MSTDDISYYDDSDTKIDFEQDQIGFVTAGQTSLCISGSNVGIGTTTPLRKLHINGNIETKGLYVLCAEPATYPLSVMEDEYMIACKGSGSRTVNLPAISSNHGRVLIIKDANANAAAGNITINPNASETIDGSLSYTISVTSESLTLIGGSTGWYIAGRILP